ncbi:MAG: peptidoglycan bridge formation glycyltransferase FemA/FemB family protein [Calditrichaeota bacterium]|nr:MAG: peptidoglycan bridge formation glycyltransferase FemA/FemB family protein [Calditrichota bacterium]
MKIILDKGCYRDICDAHPVPIFSQDWWLNVVAGEKDWDVLIAEEGGTFLAAMPFTLKKIGLFPVVKMPELTPWLNIWLNYPEESKYATRLAFEKEILMTLIPHLPQTCRFHQKYHYSLTNWLPFYWCGFKQTTRYSYVLDELDDVERAFMNFKKNSRYDIRKAEKQVDVQAIDDIDVFLYLNHLSFEYRHKKASYSDVLVKTLDEACRQKSCRKILIAKDAQSRIHAGLYLVWDEYSVYYLMGGSDPKLRESNANSLLIWEAIKFAASIQRAFDFEGSMIEPIERFFRSFGPRQIAYFSIQKNRFPFSLLEALR